jgi:hypothetical protein
MAVSLGAKVSPHIAPEDKVGREEIGTEKSEAHRREIWDNDIM